MKQIPKLIEEEIHNMNSHKSMKEIEFVITNLPTKKIPGLDGF